MRSKGAPLTDIIDFRVRRPGLCSSIGYAIHRAGENMFDIRQFLMARLPFEITEFAIEA